MGKVSDEVSEKLGDAMLEAFEQLKTEEKPKRKRRTKAEMQAAREAEQNENNIIKCDGSSHILAFVNWDLDKGDKPLPEIVEIPDSILIGEYDLETVSEYLTNKTNFCHKGFYLSWPEHHETQEEFCNWEIEKAHLYEKPEPDFDFRMFYSESDKIYLVRYYETAKTKEIIHMSLRTIYPRMMIGVVDKEYCQCVDYFDKDYIFFNHRDALDYFNSIEANLVDDYNEETGKKKRKKKKKEDDEEFDISDIEIEEEE